MKPDQKPPTNPHPGLPLENVILRVEKLKEKAGDKNEFTRNELEKALGYSTRKRSGSAHTLIAAMTQFGILHKTENGNYTYTSEAHRLFDAPIGSPWRDRLLQNMALKPELYFYLYHKYGDDLPANINTLLITRYSDRHITPTSVDKVIENYKKSLQYARLTFTAPTNKMPDKETTNVPSGAEELLEITLKGKTVRIYKKYLLEAYQKTLSDELLQLEESL